MTGVAMTGVAMAGLVMTGVVLLLDEVFFALTGWEEDSPVSTFFMAP